MMRAGKHLQAASRVVISFTLFGAAASAHLRRLNKLKQGSALKFEEQ
jgi:hypothetical protein